MGATARQQAAGERRQTEAPSKLKIQMCIKYSYFLRGRREIGSQGAISRIYKEFSILKNKNQTIQLENGQKGMKRHFAKEDTQMANSTQKRLSIISH